MHKTLIFILVIPLAFTGCRPGNKAAADGPGLATDTPLVATFTAESAPEIVTPTTMECPAPAQTFDLAPETYGRAAGSAPVWVIAGGQEWSYTYVDIQQAAPREHGYPFKVLWVIEKRFDGQVKLTGSEVPGTQPSGRDPRPLWFQFGEGGPTTTPVLDPQHPGAYSNPKYADFPSYLFLPGPGCYMVTASWEGGSWQANFTIKE